MNMALFLIDIAQREYQRMGETADGHTIEASHPTSLDTININVGY